MDEDLMNMTSHENQESPVCASTSLSKDLENSNVNEISATDDDEALNVDVNLEHTDNDDFIVDPVSVYASSLLNPQGDVRFPIKLHQMLREAEEKGQTDVVSWNPEGTCFKVYNKSIFERTILNDHFSQTKYRSFQRQLNHYGFSRITKQGDYEGGYQHPDFVRDDPTKSHGMYRLKRPKKKVPLFREAQHERRRHHNASLHTNVRSEQQNMHVVDPDRIPVSASLEADRKLVAAITPEAPRAFVSVPVGMHIPMSMPMSMQALPHGMNASVGSHHHLHSSSSGYFHPRPYPGYYPPVEHHHHSMPPRMYPQHVYPMSMGSVPPSPGVTHVYYVTTPPAAVTPGYRQSPVMPTNTYGGTIASIPAHAHERPSSPYTRRPSASSIIHPLSTAPSSPPFLSHPPGAERVEEGQSTADLSTINATAAALPPFYQPHPASEPARGMVLEDFLKLKESKMEAKDSDYHNEELQDVGMEMTPPLPPHKKTKQHSQPEEQSPLPPPETKMELESKTLPLSAVKTGTTNTTPSLSRPSCLTSRDRSISLRSNSSMGELLRDFLTEDQDAPNFSQPSGMMEEGGMIDDEKKDDDDANANDTNDESRLHHLYLSSRFISPTKHDTSANAILRKVSMDPPLSEIGDASSSSTSCSKNKCDSSSFQGGGISSFEEHWRDGVTPVTPVINTEMGRNAVVGVRGGSTTNNNNNSLLSTVVSP